MFYLFMSTLTSQSRYLNHLELTYWNANWIGVWFFVFFFFFLFFSSSSKLYMHGRNFSFECKWKYAVLYLEALPLYQKVIKILFLKHSHRFLQFWVTQLLFVPKVLLKSQWFCWKFGCFNILLYIPLKFRIEEAKISSLEKNWNAYPRWLSKKSKPSSKPTIASYLFLCREISSAL